MLASRLPKGNFNQASIESEVAKISHQLYSGNLIVDARTVGDTRVRFTLRVKDSRESPARMSASGRRTVGADWEAHRVVMDALFSLYPDMRLQTALATYRGRDSFLRDAGATYYHNAGSQAAPAHFGAL